ncbi:unnamed protein product [Protopolystoma xenopodis]|uniref:Uncharacterized protein n=1 Tax=Protopolystoma xenopodis TaxID=117903 RepID=A0A3S5CTX8_9PLAT|nr:unnamed protein product [Protopolystoma xenopodis]
MEGLCDLEFMIPAPSLQPHKPQTTTLNPQFSGLTPHLSPLTPQPSTLSPQPSSLNLSGPGVFTQGKSSD